LGTNYYLHKFNLFLTKQKFFRDYRQGPSIQLLIPKKKNIAFPPWMPYGFSQTPIRKKKKLNSIHLTFYISTSVYVEVYYTEILVEGFGELIECGRDL